VRNVGEQRPERDEQLDAEILRELEHEARERPPAEVRLGAEQEDRVAVGARYRRVEEAVVGPVEVARRAVDERDVRPRRLEVVEAFGIDLREPLTAPQTEQGR